MNEKPKADRDLETMQSNSSRRRPPSLEWLPVRIRDRSRARMIREVMASTPLFHGIGRQDWRLLSNLFHDRSYEQGEIIFERGMPGLGMYVVIEGSVQITGGGEDDETVLATLEKGDFFGEMAVIEEGVRNATASAAEPTRLIGLFRPQFRELLRDRPKLGVLMYERIGRILVERLRRADELLLQQAKRMAEQ